MNVKKVMELTLTAIVLFMIPLGCGLAEPSDQLMIHLNRPFLFVNTDQAGAPPFVGIVKNPAQS